MPPVGACDSYAPLSALPAIVGTFLPAPPPAPAAFTPDAAVAAAWKATLDEKPEMKVGIAWRGNPDNRVHIVRDIPPVFFKKLARVEGVRLCTVQKGPRPDDVGKIAKPGRLTDLTAHFNAPAWTLLDTAAVIRNMDLVVTCDTVIAHIAGSLGVRTWVALPLSPDWRWRLDGDATPWYPAMTLFRQEKLQRWDDVFDRIEERLGVLADQK